MAYRLVVVANRSWRGVRQILCGFLLVVSIDATAMWARLSPAELIERSDLVVTGTLIGQSPVRMGRQDMLLAVIKVDAVYKGATDQSVVFLVLPAAGRPLSSSDLTYRVGQSGLWFLRQRSPEEHGLFLADHPQRFTSPAEASAQLEALRKMRLIK